MTKLRIPTAMAALLLTGSFLGGCVSLLPQSKPAQLYRFGEEIGASAVTTTGPVTPLRLSTGFTQAAEGDRILTGSGLQSAYIAQSRWVSPASVLFDEAAKRAFEASGAPFRLLRRNDTGSSVVALQIEVETFEADYATGWQGNPTVVVQVRALLVRPGGAQPLSQLFESRQAADENRVGAIVKAYDAATADVLNKLVGWTTAQAGPGTAVSSTG